jgi:hypothetical protein
MNNINNLSTNKLKVNTDLKNSKSGLGFERFVYELYSDLGYDVEFNRRMYKNIQGSLIYGQIDLVYNNFLMTKFVECKYRSNSNVNFDDYSKFETTLKTFDIPLNFGEIVTNQYFDNKVIARAKECGITLVDKDILKELSDSRINSVRIGILAYNFSQCMSSTGIMNAFNIYRTRFMPFEDQIEHYINSNPNN